MRWIIGCCFLIGLLSLCGCRHARGTAGRRSAGIDPAYVQLIQQGIPLSTQQQEEISAVSSPDVTASLTRALGWLAKEQRADGSWEAYRPVRAVALAGLALSGGGEAYQQETLKAARWLMNQQQPDGSWSVKRRRELPIDQAMAIWFLATVLQHQSDPDMAEAVESGARYILDHQQADGGWAYAYGQSEYRNTFVSVCQLLALRAVLNAGILVPEVEQSFVASMRDLLYVQDRESGAFGDEFRGVDRWSATGEAVLGLQLVGLSRIPETMHGVEALEGMVNGWLGAADWPLLEAMLNHFAFQLHGGHLWTRWAAGVQEELLEWQQPDGSWNPPGSEYIQGPAYATALCCLMLQGYERAWVPADVTRSWMPPVWRFEVGGIPKHIMLTVPLAPHDLYLIPQNMLESCVRSHGIISLVDDNELYPLLPEQIRYTNAAERCLYDAALMRRMMVHFNLPKVGANKLKDIKPWALASGLLFAAAEKEGLEYDALQRKLSFLSPNRTRQTLMSAQDLIEELDAVDCDIQRRFLTDLVELLDQNPHRARQIANAWGRGDITSLEQLIALPIPALSNSIARVATKIYADRNNGQRDFYLLDPVLLLGTNNVLDQLQDMGLSIERLLILGNQCKLEVDAL